MKSILQVIILFILFSPISFGNTDKEINSITLDEATKIVAGNNENKILNAKTKTIAGKKIHIIKILTEKGLIQYIKIDAATGKHIEKVNKDKDKDE